MKKEIKERYLGHSAEVGNWGNAGEAVRSGKQGRQRPFDWGDGDAPRQPLPDLAI